MIVFTSINTGYLDKALVLAESVKRWHPDASFHIVLADYQPGNEYINDLVDHVEFLEAFEFGADQGFLFQHNVVELCTLLKPIYGVKLAKTHQGEHIVYLDPDTRLFAPLDIVVEAHQQSDVLLTPHLLTPPASERHIIESEYSALQHGLYNLGFFSFIAGENALVFLQWWAARLKHSCSTVKENGLFTDQKVVDIAPIYFDFIGILKSKRLNVATWNLFERPFEYRDSQFVIEGQPLIFYHFTGFDSGAGQRKIEANFAQNQALEQLWQDYQQQLAKQKTKVIGCTQWSLATFDDGTPIPNMARQYFRFCISNKSDYANPFASQFKQVWAESLGALLFRQSGSAAKSYLSSIGRFNHNQQFELTELLKQLTNKITHNPSCRVFLWGFNQYAQQLESRLYAGKVNFDKIYFIDKSLDSSDDVIDPIAFPFLDSDIIIICAISAKNEIVNFILNNDIPANVLSVS